jgi:hypothetical protein
MENGCLARVNLIGMKGRPGTVPGVPMKGLNKARNKHTLNKVEPSFNVSELSSSFT